MQTSNAIQWIGSAAALADLLGITPSAVSQWGETIPESRVWQLRVMRPAWFTRDGQPRTPPEDKPALTDQKTAA